MSFTFDSFYWVCYISAKAGLLMSRDDIMAYIWEQEEKEGPNYWKVPVLKVTSAQLDKIVYLLGGCSLACACETVLGVNSEAVSRFNAVQKYRIDIASEPETVAGVPMYRWEIFSVSPAGVVSLGNSWGNSVSDAALSAGQWIERYRGK